MAKDSTTQTSRKEGCCWLVGAGPGDPGLLTLKGRDCLAAAQVVVYDALVSDEILKIIPDDAEKIYAGKRAASHTLTQEEINTLLVEKTGQGLQVVRLKGGDPVLFGRGGEEAEALVEAGLRFEIVPGITSALAGPIYAGIPVTHRRHASSVTIFTGHEDPEKEESAIDYGQLARTGGTLIMLMGVGRLEKIRARMREAGMPGDLPVSLVRWATNGNQQSLHGRLDDIAEKVAETGFKAPAVAVFGTVCDLRETLNWFETRPLFGKRVVVTRTRKQAGKLSRRLMELGADVIELPTIRIEPPSDPKLFSDFVREAHSYDWLVFTSPNGVEAFFREFDKHYQDARDIGNVRIAAIGPATRAKVREYRLQVDLVPKEFVAESVIEAFVETGGVENLKILLARAETARDVLPESLTKMGAIVDVAAAYRTVPETEGIASQRELLEKEGADLVTFTSSSTAENFDALGLRMPRKPATASIGPITSQTLAQLGYEVSVEAEQYDIPGLVSAIEKYFAGTEAP